MPPVEQVISLLKRAGARWVSIKTAEGEGTYNQPGGNDKILLSFIDALTEAGIEVGGWGYVYPTRAGPQGGLASERIEKLGLAHWLIDAEGEWKKTGLGKTAELYCNSLDVNKKFEAGLCSYRFPALHAPMPFGSFMHHEKVKMAAPQVYWLGSHNPREQLERSYQEYAGLSSKPFIPIGATFGAAVASSSALTGRFEPGAASAEITNGGYERQEALKLSRATASQYWEPTVEDLKAFVDWCRAKGTSAVPGYGFYSLDWIIQKNRVDWLDAIAGSPVPEPEPQPEPGKVIKPLYLGRVRGTVLNMRNQAEPALTPATDIGDLMHDSVVPVVEVMNGWARLEGWVKADLLEKVT